MRAAGVVLVVLATVLAGCGAEAAERAGGGLTADELVWVADYAVWSEELGEQLLRESGARGGVLSEPGALDRYAQATAKLRECRSRLEERPGEPPTFRFRETFADLQGVCDLLGSAVTALVEAADPAGRTGPFVEVEQAISRAYFEWSRVGDALDAFSLARGHLPRVGGKTSQSRVEPVLTAVAARVADGRHAEVRCWHPDDWRRVLREEKALTNGALTIDSVGAFALALTGTLHLQQVHCGRLVGLSAPGPSGSGLDELSFAVGLFSHEIQHVVGPDQGEAATECAAVQHVAEVAEELGASAAQARKLADHYWEEMYPNEDEEYRSEECRPHGALDLAPDTPAWPTG